MPDEPRYPRDIPPLWLLASLLAMTALHWLWPVKTVITGWGTWFGWELAAVSVLLVVASVLVLRRCKTGIKPFSEATTLVAAGPFRFTRNPIYVGLVGVVTGIALGLGSLTPLFVPPLFWAVIDRRFVRAEERFLGARFGAAYDDYCARVRRWL